MNKNSVIPVALRLNNAELQRHIAMADRMSNTAIGGGVNVAAAALGQELRREQARRETGPYLFDQKVWAK